MEFDDSLSESWSFDSKWNDPIFGSAAKGAELAALATPISKKTLNANQKQDFETPPTIQESNSELTNEVSIGEKQNFVSESLTANPPKNSMNQVLETPKRINRIRETIQTPREPIGEQYPSPSPTNRTFSLNLASIQETPITPKTPKNIYNFKSPNKFSTPRGSFPGKISSPCSRQTIEALKKLVNPEIISICERKTARIQVEDSFSEDEMINNNNNNNNEHIDNNIDEYGDNHNKNAQDRNECDNNEHENDMPDENQDKLNQQENAQQEYNQEGNNQQKIDQNEDDQEDDNHQENVQEANYRKAQEDFIQKDIDFIQYFKSDSTPSKIFRSSQLNNISNQNDDVDRFNDLLYTKRIPLNIAQNKILNNDLNENIVQNDVEPKSEYMVYESKLKDGSISRFEFKIIGDKNSTFNNHSSPQTYKNFVPEASKQYQNNSGNHSSNQFRETDFNQPKVNAYVQSPVSKKLQMLFSQMPENSKSPIKNDKLDNKIESPLTQEIKNDCVPKSQQLPQNEPETPQNNNNSKDSILNDESQSQSPISYQAQVQSELENKEEATNNEITENELPVYESPQSQKYQTNSTQNYQENIQVDSSEKIEQEVKSIDYQSDQPLEKRIFMKILSESANVETPKIKVKNIGLKGISSPKQIIEKKREEKRGSSSNSPNIKKTKSIQILPNHQLKCTANKKPATYMVEEGELLMIMNDKKYTISKGGIINLIKGKDIVLMNTNNEIVTISKTTKA